MSDTRKRAKYKYILQAFEYLTFRVLDIHPVSLADVVWCSDAVKK